MMLEIRDVKKSFGGLTVLDGISLDVEAALSYLIFCTILTWLQHRGEKKLGSYGGARA